MHSSPCEPLNLHNNELPGQEDEWLASRCWIPRCAPRSGTVYNAHTQTGFVAQFDKACVFPASRTRCFIDTEV